MDPVTHVLLGGSVGYAAFGRRLGLTALAAGGLAAFAPDADVFIRSASDPLLAIEHHRGFTHSLSFAPVGAAIVAALWRPWRRGRDRALALWGCCLAAWLSHALLDASTSYGTQLLWPFSRHRAGWDIVSIIDPIVTLVLALGVTRAVWRRGRTPIGVALVLVTIYLGLGVVQRQRAASAQEKLAQSRGHRPDAAEVMPTVGNNIVWRALYRHEGRIYSDRFRVGWFSAPTVRPGFSLPAVGEADLTPEERARDADTRSFARFAWFSDGWVARSPAHLTVFGDMRYSLSTEAFDPIWGIRYTQPDAPTAVAWVNRSRDRRIDPGELWREIVGLDPRFIPVAGSER